MSVHHGAAISVNQLTVVRGKKTILENLNLQLGMGRITGLLGPSGSGKSTLIRAIMGVQKIQSGTVTVLGQEAGSATLRRSVAYCMQSPSVYADLTVLENVRYFAKILGASTEDVNKAIERVDLGSFTGRQAGGLSGGQLSRVSLAVALVGDPDVLVLDEPTVGLDPVLRASLWELFRSLADEGKTLLVSSHVMDEASRCDSLVFLREGAVIAHDPLPALCERTGTDSAEAAFMALVKDKK